MSDERFDVQFNGELAPGTDPRAARRVIQTRFKLSETALEDLFDGTTKTIGRDLDLATAKRYETAFAEAGARVRTVARAASQSTPPLQLDPFGWSSQSPKHSAFDRFFHYFERSLAAVLLLLISIVALIAVAELCFVLYKDLTSAKGLFLDLGELFEVFGMFLMVLIAVELMASVYMYMMDKSVHVEIMLLIAITALTRKVVVLDTESKGDPAMYMIGLAALLGTLIVGYYLVKRQQGSKGDGH